MLQNLAIAPDHRDVAVSRCILACFVPDRGTLAQVKDALAVPLRVVRLSMPFTGIGRRLPADVTSGRIDDLPDAAESLATAAGAGAEDLLIENAGQVQETAREVMSWPGWRWQLALVSKSDTECPLCRAPTTGEGDLSQRQNEPSAWLSP